MENTSQLTNKNLQIEGVSAALLKPAIYNPRKWSQTAIDGLTESTKRFGLVDPLLVNGSKERFNVVIGGHFRLKVAQDLGYTEVPVVYLDIPDETQEKELNLRLNKNQGEWDFELLAEFDESLLTDIGFDSETLDSIFDIDIEEPDHFDLQKELAKLDIQKVEAQKGDVYELGDSRLMIGDSTIASDMTVLMKNEQANLVLTDPPYILDYVHAKRAGKPTTGFGVKRNRRYLETDVLPDNFTELWMANVANAVKPDSAIIVYENF